MKDCFLVLDRGEGPNTVYPLMDDSTIGRGPDNTISLPDKTVSRTHARIKWREEGWVLEDLDSANGIIFNGERVGKIVLASGVIFKTGRYTFRFIEREIREARDHFFETISILSDSIGVQGLPAENLKSESWWRRKLQDTINEIPFFSHLEETERKKMVNGGTLHVFNPGDIIIGEGDEGRSIFVILDGRVRVFARDQQGKQVELAVLENSQFFGEMSFFTGKPRSSSIVALDKSLLVEFSFTSMEKLIKEHSPAKTVILNFYQERLADLNEKTARRSR